jgi:hypothetical protein
MITCFVQLLSTVNRCARPVLLNLWRSHCMQIKARALSARSRKVGTKGRPFTSGRTCWSMSRAEVATSLFSIANVICQAKGKKERPHPSRRRAPRWWWYRPHPPTHCQRLSLTSRHAFFARLVCRRTTIVFKGAMPSQWRLCEPQ